jgi:hypothetical protein
MENSLRYDLRLLAITIIIVLSIIFTACGGSSTSGTETEEEELPSVALFIMAYEYADSDSTNISASAYSVENFDTTNIATVGLSGMMNVIEFHLDKSLEAWVEINGEEDSSDVYVSSIASSGLVNYANDLTGFWSVDRVESGELYNFDFTDSDDEVYTSTMEAQEFVAVTNYDDGDAISGDELTLEWDSSLADGSITINISYEDENDDTVTDYIDDISNTGSYSIDVTDISGDMSIHFYHSVEQEDAEDYDGRFLLVLNHVTELTLSH